jgi:holo-[acyl-carrier protein] synthase
MKLSGVGVDVADIARFRSALRKRKNRFFESIFSEQERSYCSSYKDAAPHFAGTFAAKESVQKALPKKIAMQEIEIRRRDSGKPEVWIKGRRSPILLSITHTERLACAVAIRAFI